MISPLSARFSRELITTLSFTTFVFHSLEILFILCTRKGILQGEKWEIESRKNIKNENYFQLSRKISYSLQPAIEFWRHRGNDKSWRVARFVEKMNNKIINWIYNLQSTLDSIHCLMLLHTVNLRDEFLEHFCTFRVAQHIFHAMEIQLLDDV